MVSDETLVSLFNNLGSTIQDKAVVDKCLQLCNAYSIDEETLAELWVGYSLSNDLNFHPTVETLTQMESAELKKDVDPLVEKNDVSVLNIESENEETCDDVLDIYSTQPSVSKPTKRLRSPNAQAENGDRKLRAVDLEFVPDTYTPSSSTPGRSQSTVFRGKVLLNFGPYVQRWEKQYECEISISKANMPHVPNGGAYMYDMLSKQRKVLVECYESLGRRLGRAWNKTGPLFARRYVKKVTSISQTPFRTWGRVDITLDTSRNIKIVCLEGSQTAEDSENSPMIRLDLTGVKHYSLFSGQIVAVEGINSVGDVLVVSEIFSKGYAPILGAPTLTRDLRVYVAVGPFTASDNLTYQPLWDLMGQVAKDEPEILILVGPFLDCDHPEILKGNVKNTFQGFFNKILSRIMKCLQGKSTHIVLVPSNRDVHHNPVFPTPEFTVFQKKIGSDITNLHLMPDPCVINVCGLQIGVTSVDIIKHLGHEEASNAPGMDRLARLANHVLSQATFYPLYPPHLGLNVDICFLKKYACFVEQPHIVILPSDVKYFCTVINECLVLNPERMQKNIYAKLYVRPTSNEKLDPNNISCEIAKI